MDRNRDATLEALAEEWDSVMDQARRQGVLIFDNRLASKAVRQRLVGILLKADPKHL